jgi:hypothetical protein
MKSQLITMHTMNMFFQRHLMGILRDMVFTMDKMDAKLKDLVHTTKALSNVLADERQSITAMDASKLIAKRQSVVSARDTSMRVENGVLMSGPVIRTPARTVDTRSRREPFEDTVFTCQVFT